MATKHRKQSHVKSLVPRAAIYCRVSTAAQEENSSLASQESRCRDYAAELGWSVVDVYQDVHTGSELFERPALTRLRESLRTGSVDVVLAYALDRISRNQAHLGFLVSEFDHLDVQLAFVTEDLAETPEGRLLQSVRGFVAEVERLKIAERTKRGVRARVESGRPIPGRKAPYGYAWKDTQRSAFVINQEEAMVVRRIFDSMLGGSTLRGLANQLTQEGIPTPTGKSRRWEVATLSTILKHPIYSGQPVAYRTKYERVRGRTKIHTRPESEWVRLPPEIAPPLISPNVSDAVLAKLARNKATAPRNNADPSATLLRCGFGKCGYCGHPLQITRRKSQRHMYRCHPIGRDRHNCPSFGVMAHILDAAVWERVEEVLLDPSIIVAEVESRFGDESVEHDLRAIDRRLRDISDQQGRLARAIATIDDAATSASLLVELRQLSGDAQALTNERIQLQAKVADHERQRTVYSDLDAWCARVAQNLERLTYPEKRSVLETLGVKVRVFSTTHDPRWEIDIEPFPLG